MMRLNSYLYVSVLCAALPAAALAQHAQAAQQPQGAQQAQSTQATAPPASPPSAAKTPSQPTASTTAPAAGTSPAHASNAQELTSDEKKLISRGYHLEVHTGEKTFCRREVVLGSHFEKKVCGTADQLAASTRASRDAIDDAQMRPLPRAGN